ncbi:MAG: hypothetical protein A3A16_02615 [Candidatus Harrisonbacteria bacterium RIFCSPLOWO2_01_FULL_44_18]|uniref:O-antigen ligase-related domain-containing protein n=1 Tax=Candidatus Harrisonbacteria bacterium RIFCSPLOWO2_01_FULL_44_18 TaxID=1798407 RepID=A0A1G1ZMG5_9BACT|nr:MAG: hypothetical protein A3A16_02615 [Candidatus Harrisonbacteria bacterium RIFCSPLOWO2_01_FULL_44_18]
MNYKFLTNFYTWGVKLIIFVIPFLSLYIARSMFFPYITGRNFGFRILIEIALVLWMGLIFLNKEYRPKPSILLWSLLGFIVVLGLANLFGANPYHSFWSRYERMEGYIMILHLAAYFLMASAVLKTKKDWQILFNIFIAVGLLIGLYALFQRLGYFRAIQGGQFRVDGTIGNPTYLAGYLLFILALCAMFFAAVRKKWAKYYYGAAAAFTLLIIYFTASRGPILALLIAAVLSPLLYLVFGHAKSAPPPPAGESGNPKAPMRTENRQVRIYKRIAVSLLALMIILPTAFWLLRNTAFIKNSPTFGRLASISLTEKTTRSRFMVWNMAWQGFKERPVLGWGQENYINVFAKYYNPKMYDQEPWFDRAHNSIFDWLTNAGALGLLAYLSLFAAALAMVWSVFKKSLISFSEAAVLFVTLIAYFIQNLFVFDNFNTYILFFSLLAYISNLERFTVIPAAAQKEDFNVIQKRTNISLAVAAAALILIAPIIYFANVRPIQESQSLIGALQLIAGKATPDQVLEKFKQVLSYSTFGDGEAKDQLGRLAIQLADTASIPPENKINFIKTAIEELEKQIVKYPNDLKARLFLGTLYNRTANLDLSYRDKARVHLEEALRLSPTRQTTYFAMADNHLLINDFDGALDYLQKAVDLEPSFMEAQVNLAKIAVYAGRGDIVQKVIDQIRQIAPRDTASLAMIGDVLINVQRTDLALELYKAVVELAPDNARYRANLAGLYLNQGMKDKAREEALKAAELDPANFGKQVEEFLKNLK